MMRRRLVRIALMRSTIHLVTAEDCLAWRPLLAPPMERAFQGNFAKHLAGVDLDAVLDEGRALVEAQPRTFSELGKLLQERWPDRDAASLAQLVRAWAPLVQVPPRGLWGYSGQAAHTTAEAWLDRPLAAGPSIDDFVLRYLAALGPATVMDAQNWSGLTRLREVFERLRPCLVTFRSEDGRELFDLPDAPRPPEDTPVPARYLYDYDNLLLGHADRSRFMDEAHPTDGLWTEHGPANGAILVDGVVRGSWRLERQGRGANAAARLDVRSLDKLPQKVAQPLAAEGTRLLHFFTPEAARAEVQFLTGT
jgi:hypothetical protein